MTSFQRLLGCQAFQGIGLRHTSYFMYVCMHACVYVCMFFSVFVCLVVCFEHTQLLRRMLRRCSAEKLQNFWVGNKTSPDC